MKQQGVSLSSVTHYSIVDIETTGGRSRDNKITEIAIIVFDGQEVVKEYSTLINPEKNIPFSITSLTGITNEMVEQSPKFYEVAKNIIEILEGTTFVAHNVFFDFNFIKKEFADLGYDFNMPKLCTVKLARKFIPGHKSYSLGNICADLDIPIDGRHRAYGDAFATVELFKLILEKSSDLELDDLSSDKKLVLPHGLEISDIEALPTRCGLYYFKNIKEEVIYVGKSKDIQKRVRSHFYNKALTKRHLTFKEQTSSFDTFIIGHEWVSLIIEACEIKRLRPPLNRSLNRSKFRYAVVIDKSEQRWKLKLQTALDESCNKAVIYRSRKTALSAVEKFYQVAFGVSHESIHWNTFLKTLPENHFNQQLEKVMAHREYPYDNFNLTIKGDITGRYLVLEFRERELMKILFKDNDGIKQTYEVREDPDIKRIVLKKLMNYKSDFKIIPSEKELGPPSWHI